MHLQHFTSSMLWPPCREPLNLQGQQKLETSSTNQVLVFETSTKET